MSRASEVKDELLESAYIGLMNSRMAVERRQSVTIKPGDIRLSEDESSVNVWVLMPGESVRRLFILKVREAR